MSELAKSGGIPEKKRKRTSEEVLHTLETKYNLQHIDGYYHGSRECLECKEKLTQKSKVAAILLRNIENMEKGTGICASCARKEDRNHFYGKTHSKKTKKDISKSRTGKGVGSDNAMANPVHRKAVSTALKAKYDSGELDFLKAIQRKTAIKNQKAGILKAPQISKAEKEISSKIKELGFTVTSQHLINAYRYDIFVKEANLLIEYNGDYWHCNPSKYKPDFLHPHKQLLAKDMWLYDSNKKDLALKNGYNYQVVWETDYNKNKELVINQILKHVKED